MMLDELRSTPSLLPLPATGDADFQLVRLSEADYAAASFLDGRIATRERQLLPTAWSTLRDAACGLRGHANFIFHIGHVGSTLLSRLLGEHPAVFSVREPALLRALASGGLHDATRPVLALLGRTWRPSHTALIKATSFVSEIGPELLAEAPDGRALLLAVTPPVYLRTILAGHASRQESVAMAGSRQARLERRLGARIAFTGEGERIAMSWLCEALSLNTIAEAAPERTLWLDFDRMLSQTVASLGLAFSHLGVDTACLDVAALADGPLMRRYSKAPEHAYDAALRHSLLDEAGREAAGEVKRGLDWLQRASQFHPAVAPVLRRAAQVAQRPLVGAACPL